MKATQRIRKWNQAIHRDLGYFFAGMTVIYAISGIALNHIKEWDPNYNITQKDVQVKPFEQEGFTRDMAVAMLEPLGEAHNFKKHYFPEPGILKIFLDGGSLTVDAESGEGLLEHARRRAVFFEMNYLHYNTPKNLWTWFSDIFAGALVLLAISGLFILKGKKGITGRGAWLTAAGLIIPAVFLMLYL
ncbi:MAG: PepSY-associated TM helix domain-containing protein [Bacteroidetes bacterium]|nr:PepSY-associated TM helix domain-containing protein [Bacteroidota bacterium]